ncbi:amino acid adenylation domain-containing protein [Kibdelosporangium persicum]
MGEAGRPSPAWNDTATDYPRDRCLHEIFDEQAAARPSAVAAVSGDHTITYGELKSSSDGLAARLVAAGVQPGDRVGICGNRSLEALVTILAVLRTGAGYVPLEDTYPPARLKAMADEAELRYAVVLPGGSCPIRRISVRIDYDTGHPGTDAPAVTVRPQDCAYVMFTSGSSGQPKPVAIPHRGIVRLAVSDRALRPPTPDDRVMHALSLSSDGSTHEIWSALLNGACLILVEREVLLSPASLAERLRTQRITFAHFTTSVFHHMARTMPEALSGMRFASAGGEALDAGLTRAVLRACPGTVVVNFYGPTENSVVSTAYVVTDLPDDAVSVPIGRPLANSTAYVMRADQSLADIGEEGELLVGGDGLALGYLGDEELTAERFVVNPFAPATRLYRTGDRAAWRPDGTLEYRGRGDRQVKVRGQRIELDEVEARLRVHSAIGEAAVELVDDHLVAFVTPATKGTAIPLEDVRAELTAWLPAQAVPSRIVPMAVLPVTASGKIARAHLVAHHERDVPPVAPAPDGLLGAVSEIWQRTLRLRPAPTDNFFDVGGDSMLAAEVVTRTLATLGIDPGKGSTLVASLLRSPSLRDYTSAVAAVASSTQAVTQDTGDFEADAALGMDLSEPSGPPPRWSDPSRVLLTGATGFIGAHLLVQLLRTTQATIVCPVRARDAAHARRRVLANLARYDLPTDSADRLECVPGDIAEPGLGLTPGRFTGLSGSLDLIIHSAAQVNFLYPYTSLKRSNVDATREVIRLAAARRIPVHFLSTIGVVAGFGTAGVRHVPEDLELAHADRLTMGYAESKWVAERMLGEASRQGLPVTIHRPYEVTGEQQDGVCNTDTAICSLFKVFAEMGMAPDSPLPLDFVPVDFLASAVVYLATHRQATGKVYHLTNPRPADLSDMVARMHAKGCDIRIGSYAEWVDELVRYIGANPAHPAAPFVSLCVDRANHTGISVKEMYFTGTFPRLGRQNVEEDLADSGLKCPPVDTLLDLYLEYLFSSGYLRRPG